MIDPHREIQLWVYNQLRADPGILDSNDSFPDDIYPESPAPREAGSVIITTEPQGGSSSRTINGTLVWFRMSLLVKVIDMTNDIDATAIISGAIYDALHRKTGQTSQARIVSCQETAPFRMTESTTEGQSILHLGHIFDIAVQPL